MKEIHVNEVHGGGINEVAAEYGIAKEQWLDLSTGIAPWSWPVTDVPENIWHSLPSIDCPLQQSASEYYACNISSVLAVPGSQFAIQTLPTIFSPCIVALPERGYFEHRKAWIRAGHQCIDYSDNTLNELEIKIQSGEVDVVVVINPNNPTSAFIDSERLISWSSLLRRHGGCLIVDEAFMDVDCLNSLTPFCPLPGLVVLRSLGKFFGLAGLRLGFMFSEPHMKKRIQSVMGPWAINGPAQYLGALALADSEWQLQQRKKIRQQSVEQFEMLKTIFSRLRAGGECRIYSGILFISVFLPGGIARDIFDHMAMQGILLRRFDYPKAGQGCLRFGLVKDKEQYLQLQEKLSTAVKGYE